MQIKSIFGPMGFFFVGGGVQFYTIIQIYDFMQVNVWEGEGMGKTIVMVLKIGFIYI